MAGDNNAIARRHALLNLDAVHKELPEADLGEIDGLLWPNSVHQPLCAPANNRLFWYEEG